MHVIDSAGFYGAEVMVLNLMEQQEQLNLIPTLLSMNKANCPQKAIDKEAKQRSLRLIRMDTGGGYNLKSVARLISLAKGEGIDLFHSHGYKGNILLGSIPRFLRKIPIVTTLHGWSSTRRLSKIWIYEQLDKACLLNVDAVVRVNSKPLAPKHFNVTRGIKECVIENGIPALDFDASLILQSDRVISDFCKHGFIIGAIARLSEEKGIKHLIEGMRLLLGESDAYKAVILGDGPQRELLENMIHRGNLGSHILIAGYKENAFNYLPLFDVFVLPSLSEGLPVTLLEAMQAERPIVASCVGGVPEVLENGRYGILVQPGDTQGLAKAISLFRSNPALALEMGTKSKQIVLEKYSARRMAEAYLGLYESVLKAD